MKPIMTINAIIPHHRTPESDFHRLVDEIESLFDGLDIEEEYQEMLDANDHIRDSFVRNTFGFLHTMNGTLLQVNRVCRDKKEYALMIYPDGVQYAEITDLPVTHALEIMTEIVCGRKVA